MNRTLPSVTGRMEMTHADFQNACERTLGILSRLVAPTTPDYAMLRRLLHEAVRCSREAYELAQKLAEPKGLVWERYVRLEDGRMKVEHPPGKAGDAHAQPLQQRNQKSAVKEGRIP